MRVKKPEKWVISLDGEDFSEPSYPSKRAAVAAGAALGTDFFVGQLSNYEPTLLGGEAVDAVISLAVDELDEDTVGDWLAGLSDEKLEVLEVRLSEVLRAWLKENGLDAPFQAVVELSEHTHAEAIEAAKSGAGST
jgi:hypothetical protein